jgi:hypothetical protein
MIKNNRGSHMRIMGEINSDDDGAYESSGNESSDSNVWKTKNKNLKKNMTDNRNMLM